MVFFTDMQAQTTERQDAVGKFRIVPAVMLTLNLYSVDDGRDDSICPRNLLWLFNVLFWSTRVGLCIGLGQSDRYLLLGIFQIFPVKKRLWEATHNFFKTSKRIRLPASSLTLHEKIRRWRTPITSSTYSEYVPYVRMLLQLIHVLSFVCDATRMTIKIHKWLINIDSWNIFVHSCVPMVAAEPSAWLFM